MSPGVILLVVLLATFTLSSCGAGDSQPALSAECGRRQVIPTDGSGEAQAKWPWNVALFHRVDQTPPSYACAGTIIAKNFIITAARCTYLKSRGRPAKPQELLIRAGVGNLHKLEPNLQQVGVNEILRHEKFNVDTLQNDIAVLQTASEFEFTDSVMPLCLWSGRDEEEWIVGRSGVVAGWDHEGMDELTQHELKVVSRRNCRDSDPEYFTKLLVDRKMFCATAAPGDSGAGFFVEGDDNKWSLRGVLSGEGSNSTNKYSVFVDVARYLAWINKQIGVDSSDVENFSICGQNSKSENRPWPWHGRVYREGEPVGSAAIINERFLLSPASIFTGPELRNPEKLSVAFGEMNKNGYRLLETRPVGRVIRHENYNSASGENNIALIQLESPLEFNEIYRPVCLQRNDHTEPSITSNDNNIGGAIESVDFNCSRAFAHFCIRTKSQIALNDTVSLKNNGSWFLQGLTISQNSEGDHNSVTLLDVTRYTDWIDNNTVFRTKNLLGLANCAKRFINDYTFISASTKPLCFASHIRSDVLLATASCLENVPVTDLTGTSSEETVKVRSVQVHPFYNSTTKANNIAIVQLQQSLPGIPFCIHLEPSRKPSRLRTLFPSQGPDKYFFDLQPVGSCAEGHLCGPLDGIDEYAGDAFCTENFHGSQLFHDYGDGQGVYLRGLLDGDKRDHCSNPEVLESYVDVMFHAAWIRNVVN